MDSPPPPNERRALLWLALGAGIGLLVAGVGLLSSGGELSGVPAGAVARVNDALVATEEYQRLLAGFESDTAEVADPEDRAHVLDRMIEEELLVQRGLELGLAESDRRVRADITSAMIRSVVLEAEDVTADEEELRAFYAADQEFFTQPGRLRVRQVFVRAPRGADEQALLARASEAAARLRAGEGLDAVVTALGDQPISPLPDAMLPPAKVREYLGPTALRAALELLPGDVSGPVRSGTGYHVLLMLERDPAAAPPFDQIAELVEREWRRRAGDRALRAYLDELRARADVEVELP